MIDEVTAGVLVSAIGATGKWLATAARAPRGRKAEDLSIARWFETYKLTRAVPDALPALSPSDAEVLRGPAIQAALQELLAARLTDAPETDAARAREVFIRTLPAAAPLADFYDDEICALVARLETSEPKLLATIRSDAYNARLVSAVKAIERHTAALTNAPRDADAWLANYRRQATDQHGKLQPPDFDRRRRVPLNDIYVPATIYEDHSSERIMASPQPPPSLTVWELASRADRTVLLGDPGGGKTTASNVLMHHFASDVSRRVPFLVTLRDFAASDPPERSVVGWIEHQLETFYQCPAPPGLVDMLLLTGRAIVFFDGLDELLDTSRRSDVAARVERFCTEYPLAPVLVTSRAVGYDAARLDDRQFTCYRLGGFRDEDVTDYVRKWFALDSDACSDEADAFMSESESVTDLRSNPLLLSLMCILYRGEGSLPRNRAEIYEQCATLLFRKWDARRRIHQDLRAGRHIEPTLRHLAWWLFTREETQSAVTERALVNETSEFLHGRGFESADEAREAAQEFIEFCRGRMWVFSDMGTAATGEPLYSFTHRTFLEYFAASQLAFDSDTPEKLARTLAPHIAKGEWEVVGELAVQIKDSTSSDGAKRVYEYLLSERRRRSPEGRSNILQFLARALRSVDPSPKAARILTHEISRFLFSGDPDSATYGLPVAWLLGCCGNFRDTVSDELQDSIKEMISSGTGETRIDGLLLATTLEVPLYGSWAKRGPSLPSNNAVRQFWRRKSEDNESIYIKMIIEAANQHYGLRSLALKSDLITLDHALRMPGTITPLLRDQKVGVYGFHIIPIPFIYFYKIAHGLPGHCNYSTATSGLLTIGKYLTSEPQPPWVNQPASPWTNWKWASSDIANDRPSAIEPLAYLAGAAVFLISAEHWDKVPSQALDSPFCLGVFSVLFWYIESRKTGTPDPESLPDLPVPNEFKQVFRDWAARKVNFVGDSPDQPHSTES